MAFTFVTDEGSNRVVSTKPKPPIEEKPIRAFARGALEGALGNYGDILSIIPGYPSGQQLPGQKAKHEYEAGLSDLDFAAVAGDDDIAPYIAPLPTRSQVDKILTEQGFPKIENTEAEKGLGRFGRLSGSAATIPGVGVGNALKTGFTAAGAGELARKAGFGEFGQSVAEIAGGLRYRGKPVTPVEKIKQPRMSKGNTKPRDAGFITPEHYEKQIAKIGEEAAIIAEDIGKENKNFQTISRSINRGDPIQERLNEKFSALEETAKNLNTPIDTKPLDTFLVNEAHKYAGTGADTELSKFINEQVNGWQKSGGNGLYSLSRRYRLNNEKWREIKDAANVTKSLSTADRQKMNFLTRMNDSIKESMKGTLQNEKSLAIPGQGAETSLGNKWFQAFEDLNSANSQYKSTLTAKKILDPILKNDVSEKDLNRFLANRRNWEDINKFLGPEETQKLHTLVEDVVKARNALGSLKQKDIVSESIKNSVLGLIGGKKLAAALSVPKFWGWAKGRYYSSPEFQQNFHELVQGIIESNLQVVNNAISKIHEEEKPKKKVRFIESE